MTKIQIKNTKGEILKEFPGDIGKTLLKQLEEQKIEMQFACRIGTCGACLCEIEQGSEYIDKSFRGEPAFPLDESEVMTCIAGLNKNAPQEQTIILKRISD